MNIQVKNALYKLAANLGTPVTPPKKVYPAKRPGNLVKFVDNSLDLAAAISAKESGWDMAGGNVSKWGPKSSWSPAFIRTRIRPNFDMTRKGAVGYRAGSSAFGPGQINQGLHQGLITKYPDFAKAHAGIIDKLNKQYPLFLKYGRTEYQAKNNLPPSGLKPSDINPDLDYGGKGILTEQDYLPYINYLKDAINLLYTRETPQKGLDPATHMSEFIRKYRFGTSNLTAAQQQELVKYQNDILDNLYKYHPEYFFNDTK